MTGYYNATAICRGKIALSQWLKTKRVREFIGALDEVGVQAVKTGGRGRNGKTFLERSLYLFLQMNLDPVSFASRELRDVVVDGEELQDADQ